MGWFPPTPVLVRSLGDNAAQIGSIQLVPQAVAGIKHFRGKLRQRAHGLK
jgi:hypothetical protein